jgi:SAM-dependent methyltransferase
MSYPASQLHVMSTSYDEVPYPTAVFPQATPDRLATIARLHGLSSPDIANARILEIGGGDALNLLAVAAAYPGVTALSFDLAGTAVERGRRWAELAGIGNVAIEQMDLLDAAAGAIKGEYDYIVAHGVYAWVPEPVRAALLRLIGRVLAPNGVAFISYNALPGGHMRRAMREMLLLHLDGVEGPAERLAEARAFLGTFAEDDSVDEPIVGVMRRLARAMLERDPAVLHHDELGPVYVPQALRDVASAAASEGLAWLGDASVGRFADGFHALRDVQMRDYLEGRYFRQSLFVSAEARPDGRLDPQRVAGLFAACHGRRTGETEFTADNNRCEVTDAGLIEALEQLIAAFPTRLPCGELFDDDPHLEAMFRMFDAGLITLHAGPAPCAATPGAHPQASALARMQIAQEWPTVSTLDLRSLAISDPRARQFIGLLDGSLDREQLAGRWSATGHANDVPLESALAMVAKAGLLTR